MIRSVFKTFLNKLLPATEGRQVQWREAESTSSNGRKLAISRHFDYDKEIAERVGFEQAARTPDFQPFARGQT